MKKPERTESVFAIADILYELGAFAETITLLAAQPASAQILKERRLFGPVDLRSLQQMPPGSLGRHYADHMLTLGLDPNFFPVRPLHSDADMIAMRMRQTHDLWHVVTGCLTDPVSEIRLQAFMLAQLPLPLSALLVGSSLLRVVLKDPSRLGEVTRAVSEGMQQGREAKPLFAYPWADHWNTSLDQVRHDLGIKI